MLITRILQLLVVGIEATKDDNQRVEWLNNLLDSYSTISSHYFDRILIGINNNIDTGIQSYIDNTFSPTFDGCRNGFVPLTSIETEFKYTENFFGNNNFTLQRLKKLAKDIPQHKGVDYNWLWNSTMKKAIFYQEILQVLITKAAIPSVKLKDGSMALSLNGMINWFLYSLRILVGGEDFEKSEEVAKLKSTIIEIRKKLNILLAEHENPSGETSRLLSTIEEVKSLLDLSDDLILNRIKSNSIEAQKKLCENVISTIGMIRFIAGTMASYVAIPVEIKEWHIYDNPSDELEKGLNLFLYNMLYDYTFMINKLFGFSISIDKAKEMADEIKKPTNNQIFNLTELGIFNIFEANGFSRDDYQKFIAENSISSISSPKAPDTTPGPNKMPASNLPGTPPGTIHDPNITKIPALDTPDTTTPPKTDDGWGIGTIMLVIGIVLLVLGGGVAGIYYLTRKDKPVSEV